MSSESVINDFLRVYAEDWAQGAVRELGAYQALWPNHEEVIAEQYAMVLGSDDPRTVADVGLPALDREAP